MLQRETLIHRAAVAKFGEWCENGMEREKIMETLERGGMEKTDLRVKFDGAIDKAKALCERLQTQTAAAAKASDKAIRGHPYQAIGAAFGLGMLIGLLAMRSRRQ
jgi:ElaB/YqjD/DUF883 family membrane-anchored ribosome-binding protein